MKYLNIAVRNLSRQKKRSILLGGAIAFGIFMITLVNGFTAGAAKNIKSGFSDLLAGQIYITEETKRDDGEVITEFTDSGPILTGLEALNFATTDLVTRSDMAATIIFNGRESSQQVQGVNWSEEDRLRERINLAAGSLEAVMADPRAIIIGAGAAKTLKVEIGEVVTLRAETVTGQQNVGSFVVQGITVESSFLSSFSNYAHLERVNEMINIPVDSYQNLHVTIPSGEDVDERTTALYQELATTIQLADREDRGIDFNARLVFQDEEETPWEGSRYTIANINDFTFPIDQLFVTLNTVGLGVLIILIVITMVGVTNTFRMIMFERVKEIGTMRAMGVQRGGVRRIFLWEAFGLGTLGYVLGIIFALIGGFIIGLLQVPADNPFNLFTLKGSLTFPFDLASLTFYYLLMVSFTILAASFPANKAAKSRPADALRA